MGCAYTFTYLYSGALFYSQLHIPFSAASPDLPSPMAPAPTSPFEMKNLETEALDVPGPANVGHSLKYAPTSIGELITPPSS